MLLLLYFSSHLLFCIISIILLVSFLSVLLFLYQFVRIWISLISLFVTNFHIIEKRKSNEWINRECFVEHFLLVVCNISQLIPFFFYFHVSNNNLFSCETNMHLPSISVIVVVVMCQFIIISSTSQKYNVFQINWSMNLCVSVCCLIFREFFFTD